MGCSVWSQSATPVPLQRVRQGRAAMQRGLKKMSPAGECKHAERVDWGLLKSRFEKWGWGCRWSLYCQTCVNQAGTPPRLPTYKTWDDEMASYQNRSLRNWVISWSILFYFWKLLREMFGVFLKPVLFGTSSFDILFPTANQTYRTLSGIDVADVIWQKPTPLSFWSDIVMS